MEKKKIAVIRERLVKFSLFSSNKIICNFFNNSALSSLGVRVYSSFFAFGLRTSFFGDFAVAAVLLEDVSLGESDAFCQTTGLLRYIGQGGNVNYDRDQ